MTTVYADTEATRRCHHADCMEQRNSYATESAGIGRRPRVIDEASRRDADRVLRCAQRLLAENREELRRADLKASQALGAAGATALALMTAVVGGAWKPSQLDGSQQWTWSIGCLLWACSVATLMFALLPRLGSKADAEHVAYFGHVHRLMRGGDIRDALHRAARDPLPAVIAQLCWSSQVVMTKYQFVRCGLMCFVLAGMSLTVSFV